MNQAELAAYLRAESPVEIQQKATGENIVDPDLLEMSRDLSRAGGQMMELPVDIFFKKGNVYIRKHNRYAPMQEHRHAFLELNYMYSGSCSQRINDEDITLQQGDIIMLDKGSRHAIAALGEDDILINLLLRFDSINTQVLQKMTSQVSILATFLAQAGEDSQNYLIFKGNEKIDDLMSLILREYYDKKSLSNHLLELYLPILFTELSRSQLEAFQEQGDRDYIGQCLVIIEREYKTISLENLARRIGFNRNYLSNLIKERTGFTFKQLVQQQRLQTAYQLVLHTNYTMEEICERIGLKDPSYFYHSFKKQYQMTPSQARRKFRAENL